MKDKLKWDRVWGMGMEMLELVLDVEEHFGIKIPDEAVSYETLGEFADCVCEILGAGEGDDGLAREFEKTQELLGRVGGVDPEAIRPEMRVSEVLAGGWVYWKWRRVRKAVKGLEDLELPRWVDRLVRVCAWGWIVAMVGILFRVNSDLRRVWVIWFFLSLPALFGMVLALWVGFAGIPGKYETVGMLAEALSGYWLFGKVKSGEKWSREGVWRVLRKIIANVWCVEESKVRREMKWGELG